MSIHYLHGFRVDSELISGHARAFGSALTDLRVRFGGLRSVPGRVADGVALQSVAAVEAGMLSSTVRRVDGSLLLRVHRHVDFEMSADLSDVLAWRDPASSDGMLRIFTGGSLMGTQLMLRRALVLHASAVEVGGRAVAFVGDSGSGKSTMAALVCLRGGRFVTDDVLRVDLAEHPRCWLGSTENRLRFDLSELCPGRPDIAAAASVDGRSVWSPEKATRELSPLHAVVLPSPDRQVEEPVLQRMSPSEAIVEITKRPRIPGWLETAGRSSMFTNLARLTAQVPVYRVLMPWGPPFMPGTVDTLLDRLGLDVLSSAPA